MNSFWTNDELEYVLFILGKRDTPASARWTWTRGIILRGLHVCICLRKNLIMIASWTAYMELVRPLVNILRDACAGRGYSSAGEPRCSKFVWILHAATCTKWMPSAIHGVVGWQFKAVLQAAWKDCVPMKRHVQSWWEGACMNLNRVARHKFIIELHWLTVNLWIFAMQEWVVCIGFPSIIDG